MHHFPDGTNLFHTSKTVKNLNKLVNRDWLSANKVILIAEKTELVIFESPRKVLPDELKISYSGKSLYPSNSIKISLCRDWSILTLPWTSDSIAVKLKRANALLLKIRNYVNMKTLWNVYFPIFDSHLSHSCIVWDQSIDIVRRLIIFQKKALFMMNFNDQLFHSSPLFSSNIILKFGDKITLENIIFLRKSINMQVPSIFYDWFTFSGNSHRYDTCWSVTNYFNIPTFRNQKYRSIRASALHSWNYTQDVLKINLSLKNSKPKGMKYVLTKYFIESN